MEANVAQNWREVMRLAPDPYTVTGDRWIGSLPAHVNWSRLEDRLILRGWFPKSAINRLRVYGTVDGHEIVIEPASRQVVFRVTCAHGTTPSSCQSVVDSLARILAEGASLFAA
jgi:hypothetical protein